MSNPRDAILGLLKSFEATPDKDIPIFDIGVPLITTQGFTDDEVYFALRGLERDRIIALDERTNSLRLTAPNVLPKNV